MCLKQNIKFIGDTLHFNSLFYIYMYIHTYIYMKPAWNYLYEIKVRCGKNNSPSLVGVRYVARHSHLIFVHTRVMR